MDIGKAIEAAKAGMRITRVGWNSKDMWVAYSAATEQLPADKFWSPANRKFAEESGGYAKVEASLSLKTSQNTIQMGWSPSTSDSLATDWEIVN